MLKQHLILIVVALLGTTGFKAQTVKWAVKPTSAALSNYGNLIKFQTGGKLGLKDLDGEEVLKAEYDSITQFKNGYALALQRRANRYQIKAIIREGDNDITEVAEVLYATKYDFFSEEKICVSNEAKYQGFMGTDGNLAIPCNYKTVHPFSEGLASVTLEGKNDRRNVYYINSNMNEISVEPGNGEVIFGSTFSGGKAVVYTLQRKGYIINERGREVQRYKPSVEQALASAKKTHDYSIQGTGVSMQIDNKNAKEDVDYSVFSEGGKYGYKYKGNVILPAQLDMATPFRENYAIVKMNGQDGMLQHVDGTFSGKVETTTLTVKRGKAEKAFYKLSIPQALSGQNVLLKITDEQGKSIAYNLSDGSSDTEKMLSFTPTVANKESQKKYNFQVSCEGLYLWDNQITLNFTHPVEPVERNNAQPIAAAATKKKADFSIASFDQLRKRADQNDNFPVYVTVRNTGDVNGVVGVSLLVDGKKVAESSVSVKAGGTSRTTLSFKVLKERISKVSIQLSNGKTSTKDMKLLPIY